MFGYRRRRGRRFGYTRSRRKGMRVMLRPTVNHWEDDSSLSAVATATETSMTVATGIDDATNRSTHIPDGSILKAVRVSLQCNTIPAAVTKFQVILWRRPGGDATTNPITNYFATTDPATQSMMNIRRFKLRGPFTTNKAASDFTAYRTTLKWRGNLKIRDGDDIIATILHDAGGNLAFKSQLQTVFVSG